MVIANHDAAVVQKIELVMISINSRVLISDGSCVRWLWLDNDDSVDDHSEGGDTYGRWFAMIVDGWDDVGDDFVAVDDGGNDDRDDFCDSDEGSNDRTGIVNLWWWQMAMTYSDDCYNCGISDDGGIEVSDLNQLKV